MGLVGVWDWETRTNLPSSCLRSYLAETYSFILDRNPKFGLHVSSHFARPIDFDSYGLPSRYLHFLLCEPVPPRRLAGQEDAGAVSGGVPPSLRRLRVGIDHVLCRNPQFRSQNLRFFDETEVDSWRRLCRRCYGEERPRFHREGRILCVLEVIAFVKVGSCVFWMQVLYYYYYFFMFRLLFLQVVHMSFELISFVKVGCCVFSIRVFFSLDAPFAIFTRFPCEF